MFRALLPLLLLVSSPWVHAHEVTDMGRGFTSGFMHPLLGLDHVLAMLAVGIWGAQLGRPAIWLLPVTFPLVMAFGGVLGVLGVPFPGVEVGIALSALVLGGLVAMRIRIPTELAMAVVGLFALCHGHAHGTEIPHAANPATFALGFVLATGLLHTAGIAFGLLNGLRHGIEVLRAGGGVIALGGLYFLLLQVR